MLLSTAQRIARLGSWEWDIPSLRVTWSDELSRIYGLKNGESEGTLEYFLEYVYKGRPETLALVQESLRTYTPFDFEESFIHPENGLRHPAQ